jgi:hypothetical protein
MLAFKGPTLATLAYGDLALREFSDLDILIDAADFQRASPLLISMGYRIGYDLTPDQHQYHVARHGEALYSSDKIDVDLHIRLLGERFRLELTFGELWERRQPVTVAGGTAGCTISNEDLCVYLAVHGAKHCWQRLSWIRDMSYLLQPGVILDWPAALSRARSLGCERIVLLGLALAQQVLASALPEAVAERCREDAVVAKLTQSVVLGLFNPERMMGAFGRIGFAYRCRGRLGEALYWVAAMTFLPHVSDWRSLHLPRALWFLYPLIRPLRLAAKYLSRTGRN